MQQGICAAEHVISFAGAAGSSSVQRYTKRSGAASATTSVTNWVQSSGASARTVNWSWPSEAYALPRVTTRHRAPASRRRDTSWSPRPPASAKTSQDVSSSTPSPDSSAVASSTSAGAAPVVQALRASTPICPSPPRGPVRPGSEAVSSNPASLSTFSHCSRSMSGCTGRSSRSVRLHQPLVRPKTVSVQS